MIKGSKCTLCGKTIGEQYCDWQQGRCPHRKRRKPVRGEYIFFGAACFGLILTIIFTQ